MAFKLLSRIDRRTKYSVYGWIRNAEKELALRNVPSMIISICILYFREDEVFDTIGHNTRLSENKKIIRKIEDDFWCNYNYGAIDIPSTNDLLYTWNLKINDIVRNGIDIGITSKVITSEHQSMTHDKDCIYYKFSTNLASGLKTSDELGFEGGNHWRNYGVNWEKDDKIAICLDLKQRKIRLMINDKDQGVAFENIQTSSKIHYRFFVELGGPRNCLEIVSFFKE